MSVGECCKLIRYSHTGFKPLYQTRMMASVEFIRNHTNKNFEGFTCYAEQITRLQLARNLKLIDPDFEYWGVHVFFDPLDDKDMRFFLNHLAVIPPRHERMVDASIKAYSLDEPYLQKPVPIIDLVRSKRIGAYIPASSLAS